MSDPDLEQRAVNVIRGLAMDMPQRANSGHPGTAMALAPLAHVLWDRVMRYDAAEPDWPDRDRFVLSCGHASVLLYSMLHLTGFAKNVAKDRHLAPAVMRNERVIFVRSFAELAVEDLAVVLPAPMPTQIVKSHF